MFWFKAFLLCIVAYMMNLYDRRWLASSLLLIGVQGCAMGGATPYATQRPLQQGPVWHGSPTIQPGTPVDPPTSSGTLIWPRTRQLSRPPQYPAAQQQTGPVIQPRPTSPGPAERFVPTPTPESVGTHTPSSTEDLPVIRSRPEPGEPIAGAITPHSGNSDSRVPATLSGGIEIVPGPAIRSYRPRLEILPPPPGMEQTGVEELPAPRNPQVQELPSPF